MDQDHVVVIKPGSTVRVADGLVATVSSVRINVGGGVRYLLIWWDGRSRIEEWVDAYEAREEWPDSKVRIGFQSAAEKVDAKPKPKPEP